MQQLLKYTVLCAIYFFPLMATGQGIPKTVEKVQESVYSMVSYKDGKMLASGNAFFIKEDGTGVTDYTLLKGADRAVVVAPNGKEYPVSLILGANEMFDVVKFQVQGVKKLNYLVRTSQPAKANSQVFLLPYATQKPLFAKSVSIEKAEPSSQGATYYTLATSTTDQQVSTAVVSADGKVVALLQRGSASATNKSYALGIEFVDSLQISGLSAADVSLNNIHIPKALPATQEQALVYLYLSSSMTSEAVYADLLHRYIQQFPKSIEGYEMRASYYVNQGGDANMSKAQEDIDRMISVASNKGDAYFAASKLYYHYTMHTEEGKRFSDWSYDKAMAAIDKALSAQSLTIYTKHKGDIYFAQRKYAEAYQQYALINATKDADASTYFSAAKAKELQEGVDRKEVIALLDSAVAQYKEPYTTEAAGYIYERGRVKAEAGQYREAVKDYNTFYDILKGMVGTDFYVQRAEIEVQCRMYGQAIEDLNKAIQMAPQRADIWTDKGGLHLRVGQYDEAIPALQKAVSLEASNAEAYRMLGYAQIQKNRKAEGIANLKKAESLGDTVATDLLKKHNN